RAQRHIALRRPAAHQDRDVFGHLFTPRTACSLPPCGGGLGRGVAACACACGYPPPQPSPTRGRGGRMGSWLVYPSSHPDPFFFPLELHARIFPPPPAPPFPPPFACRRRPVAAVCPE